MKVTAQLNNIRISPRKVRLVADGVRGLDVVEALVRLEHTIKRSSPAVKKLFESALANAENNFGMDRDNLYIYDIQVGSGPTLKRWMPRAQGRATSILKKSSRIFLTLEERVEGKNRKTKEQLEKERKEREAIKAKEVKDREREEKDKEEEEEKKQEGQAQKFKENEGGPRMKDKDQKWVNRIFRRKSS